LDDCELDFTIHERQLLIENKKCSSGIQRTFYEYYPNVTWSSDRASQNAR